MQAESSRHHYMPEFVIRGFVNENGEVFIYDKAKDIIKSNPRPPKSVFWERHRNTIEGKGESTSIFEDNFYQKLDDQCAPLISKLRNETISKELLNQDNLALFRFFLVHLFWRSPYADHAVEDLIVRATKSDDSSKPDANTIKIERIGMFQHTFDLFMKSKPPQKNFFVKLSEFSSATFVLGDNSIAFESIPVKFTDLNYLDLMFPVSSTRVYISTLKGNDHFDRVKGLKLNTQIIDQSKRFVVSGNKELLCSSVDAYRKVRDLNMLHRLRSDLFDK